MSTGVDEMDTTETLNVSPTTRASLPAELLDKVLGCLDRGNVLSVRRTCSVLANAGLEHLGDEVPLCFRLDKLHALTQISKHPVLANHVKSLWYSCGFLVASRQTINHVEHDIGPTPAGGLDPSLLKDQWDMCEKGYDIRCLSALFQGCPNISQMTVASLQSSARKLNVPRLASQGARTQLDGYDMYWPEAGVREVDAVAYALSTARRRLDSLTLCGISPGLFGLNMQYEREEILLLEELADGTRVTDAKLCAYQNLQALVRPLRRLRIFFQAWPSGLTESQENELQEQATQVLNAGDVEPVLSIAREVRVLKLQLPFPAHCSHDDVRPPYLFLNRVLDDAFYPHLYELAVGQAVLFPDDLINLLLRHRATLRRLSLSNLMLANQDSWMQVFSRPAGQLRNLKAVKLRGNFSDLGGPEFRFEQPGQQPGLIIPARDALENFIVTGRERPDPMDLWAGNDLSRHAHVPEDYTPPGLPDDDMLLDDPASEYEPDEFDNWI